MCLRVKVVMLSADETQTSGNRPVPMNTRLGLEIEKYDWLFPHNFIAELDLEKASKCLQLAKQMLVRMS